MTARFDKLDDEGVPPALTGLIGGFHNWEPVRSPGSSGSADTWPAPRSRPPGGTPAVQEPPPDGDLRPLVRESQPEKLPGERAPSGRA